MEGYVSFPHGEEIEEKFWYKGFRKSNGNAIFSTKLMKKAPKFSKSRFDFIPRKINK